MAYRGKGFRAPAGFVCQVERVVTLLLQPLDRLQGTGVEIRVILIFRLAPAGFRDGEDAGVHHVFVLLVAGDVFCPKVALYAIDKAAFRFGQGVRHGVIRIYFFQGKVAAHRFRLGGRGILISVQVAIGSRCHDGLLPGTDGFYTAFFSPPGHDGGVGCQTSFDDFIPTEKLPTVVVQEHFNAVNQVALQFTGLFHAFRLHAGTAFGAAFPDFAVGFVPADVDVFRGKERHDFRQHVLEEGEGLFVADAELAACVRFAAASQLRIGSQHFFGVPRHLDFRDDGDVPEGSVTHDFPDVVLGVITAVCAGCSGFAIGLAAFPEPPVFPFLYRSPRAQFRQAGILFDFNAPACGIGQVQVQAVDFIASQSIDLLQDKFLGAEVPRHVHHETPVSEAGRVPDDGGRDSAGTGGLAFRAYPLQQGLQPVEQPGGCPGFNGDLFIADIQDITFVGRGGGFRQFMEEDAFPGRGALLQAAVERGRKGLQVFGKVLFFLSLEVGVERCAFR